MHLFAKTFYHYWLFICYDSEGLNDVYLGVIVSVIDVNVAVLADCQKL